MRRLWALDAPCAHLHAAMAMSTRRIIGIDPGLAGGVAIVERTAAGELWSVAALIRTPVVVVATHGVRRRQYDTAGMRATLHAARGMRAPIDVLVVLERQQAMPRALRGRTQGGASTFRTGLGFGLWLGLVVGLELPYVVVAPALWKRHHGLLGADKRASRLRATERFPSLGALGPADEGPAEALLLATYVATREVPSESGSRASADPRSDAPCVPVARRRAGAKALP